MGCAVASRPGPGRGERRLAAAAGPVWRRHGRGPMVHAGVRAIPSRDGARWAAGGGRENGPRWIDRHHYGDLRGVIRREGDRGLVGRSGSVWFWDRRHTSVGSSTADRARPRGDGGGDGFFDRHDVAGSGRDRVRTWLISPPTERSSPLSRDGLTVGGHVFTTLTMEGAASWSC